MSKSDRVAATDVLALVPLVNECRERGADADAWQGHLLAGLNRLVGSRIGCGGPVPAHPAAATTFAPLQFAGHWQSATARREIEDWVRAPVIEDHPASAGSCSPPGRPSSAPARSWCRTPSGRPPRYSTRNCGRAGSTTG